MKKYVSKMRYAVYGVVLFLPTFVLAQSAPGAAEAKGFVDTFNEVILYPTIALLSGVAFLVFLWGLAEYFFQATNDQARSQGVKHITWGIIGLVVMLSAWTILMIATRTFELDDELNCADDPTEAGCESVFSLPA